MQQMLCLDCHLFNTSACSLKLPNGIIVRISGIANAEDVIAISHAFP